MNFRGTLVNGYVVKDMAMQSANMLNIRGLVYEIFKRGLWDCSWRIAESLAARKLYHIGIIQAEIIESINGGCDLMCVCGARDFREEQLGLDELEYYRKQMADRIQYELGEIISRSIGRYADSFMGVKAIPPYFVPRPNEEPRRSQLKKRPVRTFEIVQRGKLEEA